MCLWLIGFVTILIKGQQLIEYNVSGTVATYFGTGIIYQKDIQSAGSYGDFTTMQILEGPTGFGDKALKGCKKLKKLVLPSTFKILNGNNFEECYNLETFSISSNNNFLFSDSYAIYNHDKTIMYKVGTLLKSYIILESTESLYDACFQHSVINSLIIPRKVKYIGLNCFNSVTMKNIEFEPGSELTEIIGTSFWWQTASIVHIPPSVVTIQSNAFSYGYSTSIIFDDCENSNLQTIGDGAFAGLKCTEIKLPPKVTKIPANCFKDSIFLTTINIPENCSEIDMTAFSGCSQIKSIIIDPNNKHFKYSTDGQLLDSTETHLYMISSNQKSITIKSTITDIASGVLQACKNIDTLIVEGGNFSDFDNLLYNKDYSILYAFPGGVKNATAHQNLRYISKDAASGVLIESFICSHCKSDNFEIGESAFTRSMIQSIRFPSTLSKLGTDAFKECYQLENITFENGCQLTTIPTTCFQYCSALKYAEIPSELTKLEKACFSSCTSELTFHVPSDSKLKVIDALVFSNCNIPRFNIPSQCHFIGKEAFRGCKKVVIDFSKASSLKTITSLAFSSCESIQSVYFGNNFTTLDSYSFQNCLSLSSVTFAKPPKITSFGSGAFQNCPKLVRFEIPATIETLEPSIFFQCDSLCDISVDSDKFFVNNSIIYTKEKTKLILCGGGVIEARIEEGIQEIAGNAFYCCRALKSVTFPSNCSVRSIKENTFGYCSSLSNVTIPHSVSILESNSFIGCSNLTRVEFKKGSSVKTIGVGTFSNCVGLFEVIFGEGSILDEISSEAFSGCSNLKLFDFPKKLTKIGANAFAGTSIDSVSFHNESMISTLISKSFGSMPKLSKFTFPVFITDFQSNIFYNSSSIKIIEFPDGSIINSIPDRAFMGVDSIESVKFSRSIQTIGVSAFDGLSHLSFIDGINFNEIKDRGFAGTNITGANLQTVTKFGADIFKRCRNLYTVDLNEQLTSIPVGCFEECSSMIDFPFSRYINLTTISIRAFASTGLKSVCLPASVSSVDEQAFSGCASLSSVTIEARNVSLGVSLFADCSNLKEIKFCGVSVDSSEIGKPPGKVRIFVPMYFRGTHICGINVERRLDDSCSLLASVVGDDHYTKPNALLVASIFSDFE